MSSTRPSVTGPSARNDVVMKRADSTRSAGTGLVLLTLASAQFLMTLDMSVMNVSMAQAAQDLGTTITGIQVAITLYTLVMATLMITGGKVGTNIGRRRAFVIGGVIYAVGSLVTAIAPNLTVLVLGWSVLEGIGAALIMPATVALVAANVPVAGRPRAYGLIAASGAIAVAVGPLLGGAATTYASWRWVFVGEVFVALVLVLLARRITDVAPEGRRRLDGVGAVLSAVALGMIVFGVLQSSEWGWVQPRPGSPEVLGLSPTLWLVIGGGILLSVFLAWERRMVAVGREPLVQPSILANRQLNGGLAMTFFEYLIQSGTFFVVPLFLSVVLELPAVETGVRVLPLSVSLLVSALGIPRVWPNASPRRVVQIGMVLLLAGILALMSGIDIDSSAAVVAMPMFLIGLGIGCLAAQVGAVTVSAVPDEQSGEVGGLQNTASNLGASVGTALAGSVLIAILTGSVVVGITDNPDVPREVATHAGVELERGVSFLSDTQLRAALSDAEVPPETSSAIMAVNRAARVDALHAALAVLAFIGVIALLFTGFIPVRQPTDSD